MWLHTVLPVSSIEPWRLALFALAWTIWKMRNRVVFRHGTFDSGVCLELFWFHYAWWSRLAWGDCIISVSDVLRCLAGVTLPNHSAIARPSASWLPPCPNRIKVNVDGSFSSMSGASGIGGVFRDHLGTVLLHFAKHVKADSTIHAEILAIKDGFLIAAASRWSGSIPSRSSRIQPMRFHGLPTRPRCLRDFRILLRRPRPALAIRSFGPLPIRDVLGMRLQTSWLVLEHRVLILSTLFKLVFFAFLEGCFWTFISFNNITILSKKNQFRYPY